jgi:hypothetical protein
VTDIRHLVWRKTASAQALHAHGHGRALASIEPDAKYPRMWRVRMPDGRLSDMARLEWAKEGALQIVLAEFNRRKTPSGAPPVRQNRSLVLSSHVMSAQKVGPRRRFPPSGARPLAGTPAECSRGCSIGAARGQ